MSGMVACWLGADGPRLVDGPRSRITRYPQAKEEEKPPWMARG